MFDFGNDSHPPVVGRNSPQPRSLERAPIKCLLANLIYDAACLQQPDDDDKTTKYIN